jgi:hypothetical protein
VFFSPSNHFLCLDGVVIKFIAAQKKNCRKCVCFVVLIFTRNIIFQKFKQTNFYVISYFQWKWKMMKVISYF